jgi:glutathione S-transferase
MCASKLTPFPTSLSEGHFMILLYHTRDAVCPMKVRIALAEKGLEWESHLNPDMRSPEYLALNPRGYVPTLVHDGHVLTESRIISEYIEDAFPDTPLMPLDSVARHRARYWSKQIDDTLHLNVFVLTFLALGGWGLSKLSEEERQRRLPMEPVKRTIAQDLLRDGIEAKWVAAAIARFRNVLRDMDKALQDTSYLAGDEYSLADVDLSVYTYRLGQLTLDPLWQDLPHLQKWTDRVYARPAFQAGVVDWLTPAETGKYDHGADRVAQAALDWLGANS